MSLSTLHPSVYKLMVLKPRGLSSAMLPPELRVFIEREALDIYTRMVNSGASLQATLAAVYLSGMSSGSNAMRGEGECKRWNERFDHRTILDPQ